MLSFQDPEPWNLWIQVADRQNNPAIIGMIEAVSLLNHRPGRPGRPARRAGRRPARRPGRRQGRPGRPAYPPGRPLF